MKMILRAVLVCVVGLTGLRAAERPAGLHDFDAYVARVQQEFDVPGLAVAIVKDGEVVLAQGYGVRELGRPEPVDGRTLFAIASNTKAFTAAGLAILMDEGKVAWDDRVTERLPWFRMSDPYVTAEMTVRDLLTHRSGLALGAGDLLFWPATDLTTREVVERLRFVPLANSFRAEYAYDNILYAAAGLVLEEVSGMSWKDFMRQRIFAPVGMTDSLVNWLDLPPGGNAAMGHAKYDFKDLKPVPPLAWDNASAAGGIYSSAQDMAKWVRVQLAGGRLPAGADGKEAVLFQPARQKAMWSLVTPMGIGEPKIEALKVTRPNFRGYGLGWDLADYRGRKVVSHTGGWPGQVSKVALIPELGLGVVVLTNAESGAAFQAVSLRVLDAYLGAPATDWVAAYAELMKQGQGNADESWAKLVAGRAADSTPSLPLAKYAGTYRDVWRGDVFIEEKDGKLAMRFSRTEKLTGDLEHWQHDTFIVRWHDRSHNADAFVTFALTPAGGIDQVKMEAISPLTDFSFDFHDLVLKPVAP
ncbi:Penicillin-binding protein 4* [Lacunisphaera limnophila]|uniref:Penicillin-binding protein 4 n=1 Tax=Lacunisphaera limnophila TaxID=1838286 RepID=A0A1D8ATI9_9BACT|nr:serine hydrolase [Lacunisphaera limnophila]AOS44180.1 Penicillin-binding protein 4* [Lacunisphaera limnophila]